MNRELKYLGLVVLVLGLIVFRAIGDHFFYDPFVVFFAHDYLSTDFVEYKPLLLFLNLFLRFVINMLLSLGVIYFAFERKDWVILASKVYGVAFLVLSLTFYLLLLGEFKSGYLFAFYVRRILIHPILLLVLLPAFYYHKRSR